MQAYGTEPPLSGRFPSPPQPNAPPPDLVTHCANSGFKEVILCTSSDAREEIITYIQQASLAPTLSCTFLASELFLTRFRHPQFPELQIDLQIVDAEIETAEVIRAVKSRITKDFVVISGDTITDVKMYHLAGEHPKSVQNYRAWLSQSCASASLSLSFYHFITFTFPRSLPLLAARALSIGGLSTAASFPHMLRRLTGFLSSSRCPPHQRCNVHYPPASPEEAQPPAWGKACQG